MPKHCNLWGDTLKAFIRFATSLAALLTMEIGLVGCEKRESPAPVEILVPKPRRITTAKPYGHTRSSRVSNTAGQRESLQHLAQKREPAATGTSKKQVDIQPLAPLPLVGGPLDRNTDRRTTDRYVPTFLSNPKAFLEKDQQRAQLPETAERNTPSTTNTARDSADQSQKNQPPEGGFKDSQGHMAAMAAGAPHAASNVEGTQPSPAKPANTLRIQDAPTFSWPVVGRILSRFGHKDAQHFNDGINIATRTGMPVRAAADGVVSYVGNKIPAFGNMLVIKHVQGWSTTYSHTSKILIKKDQKVRRGQIIAHAGDTGNVKEPQLHFEIRYHGEPVAPFEYLGP